MQYNNVIVFMLCLYEIVYPFRWRSVVPSSVCLFFLLLYITQVLAVIFYTTYSDKMKVDTNKSYYMNNIIIFIVEYFYFSLYTQQKPLDLFSLCLYLVYFILRLFQQLYPILMAFHCGLVDTGKDENS